MGISSELYPYIVIADDEVKGYFLDHEQAQLFAKRHSQGRYPTAKVIYMPNQTMQGHWFQGNRIQ